MSITIQKLEIAAKLTELELLIQSGEKEKQIKLLNELADIKYQNALAVSPELRNRIEEVIRKQSTK